MKLKAILAALTIFSWIGNVNGDEICKIVTKVSDGKPNEFKCNVKGIFYPIDSQLLEFSEELESGDIASGDTIEFTKAFVMDRVFHIAPDSSFTVLEKAASANSNASTPYGTKKVLAIWVKATNSEPTLPMDGQANSLADDVFGLYGDPYNPRSQYTACSDSQLDMAPASLVTSTGVSINNGVYALEVGSSVASIDNGFEETVAEAATNALGDLESQFDYVMFCMPNGVKYDGDSSFAYAYLNSYLSVYGDKECHYETGAIHEFGHNFGLDHSNEGPESDPDSEYSDYSGQMGASDSYDDGTVFCFNGPKTWQLGWFSSHHVELTSGSYSWTGDLYGTSDYSSASSSDKMIVKLADPTGSRDFYVSYNAATGANVGTYEAANKVMVHYVNNNDGYSWLVKKMNQGGTYDVTINGKTVPIKVDSIGGTPKRATVTIGSAQEDDDDDDYYDDDYYNCQDSSTWKRKVKGKNRKCPWFGRKNPFKRCRKPGALQNCPSSCDVCGKTGVEVCEGRNLKKNACNKVDCCIWNSSSLECESNVGDGQCF